MKAALPAILISVGALIALGVPGVAIGWNIHLRTAGRLAQRTGTDADLALLAWVSMFAVPFGVLLMLAGFIIRRARKLDEEAAAQRKARRAAEADRTARPTHAD